MAGWCPRHDRVHSSGTTCPDCGAALVAVSVPARQARHDLEVEPVVPAEPVPAEVVIDEPFVPAVAPARSPDRFRIAVAALRNDARATAILAAALTMLIVGAGFAARGPLRAVPVAAPSITQLSPGTVEDAVGIGLRLNRAFQRGDELWLDVDVVHGFDTSLLQNLVVDIEMLSGRDLAITDPSINRAISGFTAGFTFAGTIGDIAAIRIATVEYQADPGPDPMTIEISKVWPLRPGAGPLAVPASQERHVGGGSVRWISTIFWRDQVEVVIDRSRLARSTHKVFKTPQLFHSTKTTGGEGAEFITQRDIGDVTRFEFGSIPNDATDLALFLGPATAVVQGDWEWRVR